MLQKLLITKLLFVLVLTFTCFNSSYAYVEKGDTLVVEQADVDVMPLNEVIAGDTLSDGSRKHTVYELVPDGWYSLSATITAGTYDLHIVGGKRTADQSRPVILAKEDFGGWFMISASKNITIKGVHFMQIAETYGGNIGPWARAGISLEDINSTVILHDNVWDFNTGFVFAGGKDGLKLKVSNCLFRFNLPTNNNVWAGQGFDTRGAELDTVIFKNCTWYGGGPFLSISWESSQNLFMMDHCTIVDWVQFPIHSVHYNNAVFTNNLFYNAHTLGEDSTQIVGQDPDGLPYGILNIDTVYVDSLTGTNWDMEASRNMHILNNNNFVKQNIKDYWATAMSDDTKYHMFRVADPTYYDGFLNARTRAMFEDDAKWPGLIHENTVSEDPQFENYFDYSDTLIAFSKAYYSYAWPDAKPTTFMKDPDGEPLIPTDPMVYNLKVTNPALRTASTTGGVIGDLTWELANGYNSVASEIITDSKQEVELPDSYELFQNYPNPFNPSSVISFSLPKNEKVTLEVFNLLGEKVATLINNEDLNAGVHKMNFNGANLTSGVYFYKLSVGSNFITTKKMALIK